MEEARSLSTDDIRFSTRSRNIADLTTHNDISATTIYHDTRVSQYFLRTHVALFVSK